jgi:translation initiation factor 2 beta subunit (eIF-2beta)/eIF-5
MEKTILQNVSPDERIEMLKANAVKTEKFSYARELEQSEIQELQNELSQQMIAVDQEDQKLKVHKEAYKSVVKPIKTAIGANLQKIRTGVEEVNDDVFLMKDLAEEKMGYYSKEGKLVFERKLKPEELQYSINDYSNKKTGTND